MKRKLYKNKKDKIIAGVCSGLAEYLEIDVVFIRVFFLITAFFWGTSVLIYLILIIVMPTAKEENNIEISNAVEIANDLKLSKGDSSKHARENLAIFLIISGIFATLDNLLAWLSGKMWIPVILITIGILILKNVKDSDE
ncbi:MAG: PspC domain-containing protein [Candidatus Kapaibacteriota bacterium]